MRHIANVVSAQVDPGFESRPLRHSPGMKHALLAAVLAGLAACRTTRVLHVESDPPGAVVRLDEEVIGTTPLDHEFVHGGQRRVSLYLEGYRTWSRRVDLEMPWYARFPMDIVTEVLVPLGLDHEFHVRAALTADTREEGGDEPAVEAYLERAAAVRARERTRSGKDGE